MKKTVMLLVLAFISLSSLAQLANTKWKVTLQLENATEVYFDFGRDTVKVYVMADSSLLETSLFTQKDGEMTILKVNGISQCEGVTGTYNFEIKGEQLVLTLKSDQCFDRGEVLDKAVLTRI
jgi:hypothetical protein